MVAAMVVSAALLFSLAGYFMKLSDGLTATGPTALVFALVVAGTGLQALAMRNEAMTVVYVMVLGLEAVAASLLGAVLLGEQGSPAKVAGIALVLAGIGLLQFEVL